MRAPTGTLAPSMDEPDRSLEHDILYHLLEVARQLSASVSLREILSVIIDAMRDAIKAERATVLEYDADRDELFSTVAHGLGDIRIPAGTGLAGICAREKRIINVADAYADDRFNPEIDKQTGFRTRSILTVPLVAADGALCGVSQVLNKKLGTFDAQDEQVAGALASLAAVAIRRGRLIEDRLVRQKLERDLELARQIQQSAAPQRLPVLDGFTLAAWSEPAEATGGDTYDVMPYPSPPGAGAAAKEPAASRALLLLADATGHGVGPALSVTQVQAMLRMAVRLAAAGGSDLAELARHVNLLLCDDLPEGRFITAWLGELDTVSHTLLSLSAGQGPLLWYRAARGAFEVYGADTFPFGVSRELKAVARRVEMQPGDIFAAISDGVFEAADESEEWFGVDRVKKVISDHCRDSPTRILAAVQNAVRSFTGDRPAADDRTAVVVKRTGE